MFIVFSVPAFNIYTYLHGKTKSFFFFKVIFTLWEMLYKETKPYVASMEVNAKTKPDPLHASLAQRHK